MKAILVLLASVAWAADPPLGQPGFHASYKAAGGNIAAFELHLGPESDGFQWIRLTLIKRADQSSFRIWALRNRSGAVRRYLVDEGSRGVREYSHELTGEAVLPSHGGWTFQWPAPLPVSAESSQGTVQLLGHAFHLELTSVGAVPEPPPPAQVRRIRLRPDLWIGPASNTRQKDETRRYDGSDYELIPLAQSDYRALAESGVTVVKAAPGDQQAWAEDLGLFFWGPHERLPYPEFLYRSQYLGPALFLDEPAVGTRDHDLRPRLAKDPAFRRAITPDAAFSAYRDHYARTISKGPAQVFMRTLAQRRDVDLGGMSFSQSNLFNWETMPSTAAWALSQDPHVPSAMVFEPPGRIGTRRTIPEFNMAYGTHFAIDDMRVLPAIIAGFLRGGARSSSKDWGLSIYGAVEPADTFWWLTRAYDLGATRFFFWDNYQLACVPFGEVLALSRHLRAHARQNPRQYLARLRNAATRAITLPPGYDLGHTHMGRGNLWGITELNLERTNVKGVTYRSVTSRFFAEIEKSIREGVTFDLLWDLPGRRLDYREVVRIGEEDSTWAAQQVSGISPNLSVSVTREAGVPGRFTAVARLRETDSPVYYTHGADAAGVLHNAMVLWELYGPGPEDYNFLMAPGMRPIVRQVGPGEYEIECAFETPKPGVYRLRAASSDVSGRTTVVWREFRAN